MRREVYSRPDGAVIRASGRRADGGETAQPAERRQSGQRGRVREEGGEGPSCDKTISAEQSSTGQTQFLGSWGNPLGRGDPGGHGCPKGTNTHSPHSQFSHTFGGALPAARLFFSILVSHTSSLFPQQKPEVVGKTNEKNVVSLFLGAIPGLFVLFEPALYE